MIVYTILYYNKWLSLSSGAASAFGLFDGAGPTHYNLKTLARDKGGPSIGGFLNNRLLFSYTYLYLCNDILMVCVYKQYINQENNR